MSHSLGRVLNQVDRPYALWLIYQHSFESCELVVCPKACRPRFNKTATGLYLRSEYTGKSNTQLVNNATENSALQPPPTKMTKSRWYWYLDFLERLKYVKTDQNSLLPCLFGARINILHLINISHIMFASIQILWLRGIIGQCITMNTNARTNTDANT